MQCSLKYLTRKSVNGDYARQRPGSLSNALSRIEVTRLSNRHSKRQSYRRLLPHWMRALDVPRLWTAQASEVHRARETDTEIVQSLEVYHRNGSGRALLRLRIMSRRLRYVRTSF